MAPKNQYLTKLKNYDINLYEYFMRGMEIVTRLSEKMYEAYIVGGAVRDYLLNEPFKDIDIATTATPKEILEIFPDADGRFSELGCVELKENGRTYQITTFREENLVITRKTKDIHYSKKLTDDVLRRDYTINALALTTNYNVVDIIKGQKDLRKRIIRVIGKGKKRFREDPLRVYRGFELVSRYNFKIEFKTANAMKASRKYLADVSENKKTEALVKILNGKYARNAILEMADLDLFRYDAVYKKWLLLIGYKYKKTTITEKFAALYYMYGSIPQKTCFDRNTINGYEQIIQIAQMLEEHPIDAVMVYKYGAPLLMSANQVLVTVKRKYKNQAKLIKKLDDGLVIRNRKELKFTPEELIQMMDGKTGTKVTEIMDILVNKVINREIANSNALIRQEVLRLLAMDNSINNPQKEEAEEPKIVDNTVETESTAELEKLKNMYMDEFKQLYNIYMRGVEGYDTMDHNEQIDISNRVKEKVKQSLVTNNAKYNVLVERGII